MTGPAWYQIHVVGHLSDRWADWFGGLTITNQPDGEAVLSGQLPDQAALYGVLNRIRNIGLTLVALSRVEPDAGKMPLPGDAQPIQHDTSCADHS